jgi:RNA polymerase sigma factor (sigma-70 family)
MCSQPDDPIESAPDERLVTECIRGSQSAWRVLVKRYQRLIFAMVGRSGFDQYIAADVLQTVFERLFSNLPQLTQPERLQAWIVTTTKREIIQLRRREAKDQRTEIGSIEAMDALIDGIEDPAPLTDEIMDQLQQAQRMRVAMDQIDERCQKLLTMLYTDEDHAHGYREIAETLAIPEGSIGPTRSRCLAKLRKIYDA